jgi:hypothetical protein
MNVVIVLPVPPVFFEIGNAKFEIWRHPAMIMLAAIVSSEKRDTKTRIG